MSVARQAQTRIISATGTTGAEAAALPGAAGRERYEAEHAEPDGGVANRSDALVQVNVGIEQ